MKSRIFLWTLIIINLTLVIINLGSLYSANYKSFDYNELEVDYGDLNETEILIVDSIMDDIRLEYRSKINSITFIKDVEKLRKMAGGDLVLGLNRGGDIYILFSDYHLNYQEPLMRTICHEILHNIISGGGEEFFVGELEEYMSCYYPAWKFLSDNRFIEKCQDCGVGWCQGIGIYGRGDGKCCSEVSSQEEYENLNICWFTEQINLSSKK